MKRITTLTGPSFAGKSTLEAMMVLRGCQSVSAAACTKGLGLGVQLASGNHIVIVCEPVDAKKISEWCKSKSDVSLTRVFVDNPRSVINERFLRLACEDILNADSDEEEAGAIKYHAAHMTFMTTVEDRWRIEAYGDAMPYGRFGVSNNRFHYDVLLCSLDESNSAIFAEKLTKAIPDLC